MPQQVLAMPQQVLAMPQQVLAMPRQVLAMPRQVLSSSKALVPCSSNFQNFCQFSIRARPGHVPNIVFALSSHTLLSRDTM